MSAQGYNAGPDYLAELRAANGTIRRLEKLLADLERKLAVAREALDGINASAETNAGTDPDDDRTITLNHIADTAGEALDALTPTK